MNRSTAHPADEARDERLAHLLNQLFEARKAGKEPDLAAFTREDPGLERELRSLWAIASVTEELASSSRNLPPEDGTVKVDGAPVEPAPLQGMDPLEAGTFQHPDYELLGELGRGGMGIVYKARQRSLNRLVALKMLLRGVKALPADIARFRVETEAVAQLDHPNITPVYEAGVWERQPFFTMRLIEGTTLARRLNESPIAPREAAQILVPVARAIHYAHERGVLHRDLKPQNVMIASDGTPFVMDFGLAKRLEAGDSLTQSGAVVGTPSYMSPEQAGPGRRQLGPASDVYSLGAVLYHMVTGRPPFQAASPVDAVLAVLENDPLPPRILDPKIDRDLEMIILKCLQKPMELRYPSAEEFAADLEAYLEGEPVAARSSSLRLLLSRAFRDTHHAAVLEHWGLLWMWHSAAVLLLCVATNWLQWQGEEDPGWYLGIWTVGFGTWAAIFWALRSRAGPITFVEKQVAHIWGASILTSTFLFPVEILLGLKVLTLSPVLGLVNGSVFFVKAAVLSGTFYIQAGASFATSILMALFPSIGLSIFGVVTAACFFFPGWKYHHQRLASGKRR